MRRSSVQRVAAVLLWLSVAPALGAETFRYVGQAYDASSGEPIYTENHAETREGGVPTVHGVEYRAPDGSLIATKTIDYRKSRTHPDFRLEDARDGYLEGGELVGDRYKLYVRDSSSAPVRSDDFRVPERFVADAGFNQFMALEWDRLSKGERLTLNFAAPPRLDFFRFRAGLVEEKDLRGRRAGVFRVEVDNALIRMFVDPILLTYDLDTRELLEFAGMANINDPAGKSYVARIVFPQGQRPPPEAGTLESGP